MKPWIKIAIGVVAGFGAGFGSGFFCHKKINDLKFEEITEEEFEKIEQTSSQKEENAESASNQNELRETILPTDPDELKKTLQNKVSYVAADQESKEKYSQMWNRVKEYSNEENANNIPVPQDENSNDEEDEKLDEGIDEDFMNEIVEEEETSPGDVEPPHPISMIDYYNERLEYDKVTIEWYQPDNTLVDENEEVIADPTSYVGKIDIQELFANTEEWEDPDIRFIRNEGYGSDYEIIRHHQSWQEAHGGA